jgi:hypothetical protein
LKAKKPKRDLGFLAFVTLILPRLGHEVKHRVAEAGRRCG